jgi:hypothetical protein
LEAFVYSGSACAARIRLIIDSKSKTADDMQTFCLI